MATRSPMRALRLPALLTAIAVALGVVAVQSGNAGASDPASAASSQSAPTAATVHIMRAPTVTSTIVARAAHVAGATTRVRGTTTTSTRRGRRVVVVRVVSTSTARATATVTDGEVSGTEVRLSKVTRSVSASVVIKGSRRAATKAASRAAARVALTASRSAADKAAKTAAVATAVGAATETYRRRRDAAPTSSPSPSPSVTGTATPTDIPTSAAPTSSSPAPAPTDPSATPAPTTAAPTPTPTPTVTVNPNAMPTGNLPGWTQVFAEDFTTAAPLGSFLASYGSRWGAYPSPWKDTSGHGVYNPGKTMSASGGMMDLWVHTESGVHYVAAPQPKLPTMTYGRFSARFQADSTAGYKVAWLLWPDSGVWPADGEVDFPEGDLNSNMSAFAHFASSGGGQDAFTLPTTFAGWHTATINWTPGKLVFLLDGKIVGTSTKLVPSKPMHWVMQTETTLNGSVPSNSASGHVRVDWVTAYAYTP